MMTFTWIPIYRDLTKSIKDYHHRQGELIRILQQTQKIGLPGALLNDKEEGDKNTPLAVMDPFTFFASFNRGLTLKNRQKIIEVIQEELGLPVIAPSDFDGIPIVNNQNSWFFAYKKNRAENDINALWDLAIEVIEKSAQDITPEVFNKCLKVKGVGISKITSGCFWLNPENYFPCDSRSKEYCKKKWAIDTTFSDHASYLKVIDAIREKDGSSFAQISHNAFLHTTSPPTPPERQYWLYAPGEDASLWAEFLGEQIMGIGWDAIGNISELKSIEAIKQKLIEDYGYEQDPKNIARACYDFAFKVREGDFVFVKKGKKEIVGYGEVASDYKYDSSRNEHKHTRVMKWLKSGSWPIESKTTLAIKTLTNISPYPNLIAELKHIFEAASHNGWIFQANPDLYDIRGALKELETFTWSINQFKDSIHVGDTVFIWESGKNCGVLARGTVQSEPSEIPNHPEEKKFNKEKSDFSKEKLRVEGHVDCVLKKEVPRDIIKEHPILSSLSILKQSQGTNYQMTSEQLDAMNSFFNDILQPEYSIQQISDETGFQIEELERWKKSIERKRQAIFYGPPGTGKTFVAERMAKHFIGGGDGFSDIVQFHPSYSYEDFIQGIRPQTRKDGGLEYNLVPGRFLDFIERANACDGTCVLIIDEINRGNLSRIFGELMFLLEYRDRAVPLAAGGALRIPENVRIIGTMNTADRSIALVDNALRRRFAFLSLYPDFEILKKYHDATGLKVDGLIRCLKTLNRQIADRHYAVGISFFMRDDLEEQIEDIWRMEIEPYVEEYFFDQTEKAESFRWIKVKDTISL